MENKFRCVAWKSPGTVRLRPCLCSECEEALSKGTCDCGRSFQGGGQATYASQQTLGIHKVITINSARPPFADHPNRHVTQRNVIVPGEVIGDPKSGLPIGGLLPGKYVGVKLTTDRPTLIKAGVLGDAISTMHTAWKLS